ncbi:MAG: helix-turn-helix transcriptional regulator [Acidobacteriota bacterium]
MEAVIEHRSRALQPQPLDIVNVPGALLNIRTVEILVGFKKTKILEEVKAKRFPAGHRESPTCTRWLSDDIKAYLEARSRTRKVQ